MGLYVARRLLLVAPTVFIVTLLVFAIVRLIPGDVVDIMLAQQDVTRAQAEEMRTRLGLDQPIHVQYWSWLTALARGDLGRSLYTGKPVVEELLNKIPVTLELGSLAIVLSILIGIPIGILSAIRQDSIADYLARSLAIGGLSVPNFWLGYMLIVFFSIWVGWIPPVRYVSFFDNPLSNLQQLLMPASVLALGMGANVMRMTRTTLLEVLRQDYIRTAWAKGLRETIVVQRHALKNAMLPVVTIIGVNVAVVLSGSVIMEQVFVLPGAGKFTIESVLWRDYPAIQALNLFLAVPIIMVNLIIDILVGYLDPRVRYG